MTKKTNIWKTSIMLILSLTFLMMAAASVNAETTGQETIPRSNDTPIEIPVDDSTNNDLTDNMLISPGPEEPLIIAPNPDTTNEVTDDLVISGQTTEQPGISSMAIPSIAFIAVIAAILVSLIIVKRKK